MRMLKNLAQGSREILEMLLLVRSLGGIAAEVERGKHRSRRKWLEQKALAILGKGEIVGQEQEKKEAVKLNHPGMSPVAVLLLLTVASSEESVENSFSEVQRRRKSPSTS